MVKTNTLFKKLFAVVLPCLLMFSSVFTANAAVKPDDTVSPCYVNIVKRDGTLTVSGIKAKCTALVQTSKSMNLSIKMELQKEKSSGYEIVETWTGSKTGTYLSMSESRNINVLSNYRLKITFNAGGETQVVYRYQ